MKNQTQKRPALAREVMTTREAAAYLKCHPTTLYRLFERGEIPAFRLGSDLRFKRSVPDDWIARKTVRVTAARDKPRAGRGRRKR